MAAHLPPQFTTLRINKAPGIYHCEAGWKWAPQPLTDHDFWFVISGSGRMAKNGNEKPIAPGSCVIFRPGDTPCGTQNPQDRLTVFFVHFDVLDERGNISKPLDFPQQSEVRDTMAFVTLAHRIVRLWQRGDAFACHQAQMVLGILLWQLWDEGTFSASPTNEAFETLAASIRREPGRRWTLDEMARQTSLSRAQFARCFRKLFGVSPMNFVIQTRLERAQHLLKETQMTLEQIAFALGYSDVYFFARQFKQVMGNTPGTLRKR